MPTYHGSFERPAAGTWDIVVPEHAAPGDAAVVDGCPGSPRGGWSVVGETDQTLQLTRSTLATREAPGVTYDLVLNKASGGLTITASLAVPGPAGTTLVYYGGATGC